MTLTSDGVRNLRKRRLVFPTRVASTSHACEMLNALQRYQHASNRPMNGKYHDEPHRVFPCINDLMREHAAVDVVTSTLAPDFARR